MISFCCPSRGRPELAKRLVDTATATQKYDTEFLFYLNDDDETLEQYKDLLDEKHYTVGPNQSTCYSWNLMCEKASHDIVQAHPTWTWSNFLERRQNSSNAAYKIKSPKWGFKCHSSSHLHSATKFVV